MLWKGPGFLSSSCRTWSTATPCAGQITKTQTYNLSFMLVCKVSHQTKVYFSPTHTHTRARRQEPRRVRRQNPQRISSHSTRLLASRQRQDLGSKLHCKIASILHMVSQEVFRDSLSSTAASQNSAQFGLRRSSLREAALSRPCSS